MAIREGDFFRHALTYNVDPSHPHANEIVDILSQFYLFIKRKADRMLDNTHLDTPNIHMYMRRSRRRFGHITFQHCIDMASVEISYHMQGRKVYQAIMHAIEHFADNHQYPHIIFIENIISDKLYQIYKRLPEYAEVETFGTPCFYRLPRPPRITNLSK